MASFSSIAVFYKHHALSGLQCSVSSCFLVVISMALLAHSTFIRLPKRAHVFRYCNVSQKHMTLMTETYGLVQWLLLVSMRANGKLKKRQG